MPIINEIITPRSWIQVRDRIGLIIADELFNQSAMTYEDWINADVYVERWRPITHEECLIHPVVTVGIESITPSSESWIDSRQSISFSIMIHTAMMSTQQESNDILSMFRNQYLTSIIHAILSHPQYVRLGFNPPFIERRRVSDIKFGQSNRQESMGLSVSIITFDVQVSQCEPMMNGLPIAGASTMFKLNETDKGFLYEYNA